MYVFTTPFPILECTGRLGSQTQLTWHLSSCQVTKLWPIQKKLKNTLLSSQSFLLLPRQVLGVWIPGDRPMRWKMAVRCLRLQMNVYCVNPPRFYNVFVTAAQPTLSWLDPYSCLSHDSRPPPEVQDINILRTFCSTKYVKLIAICSPQKTFWHWCGLWEWWKFQVKRERDGKTYSPGSWSSSKI